MIFSKIKNSLIIPAVGILIFISSCSKTPLGESAIGSWTLSSATQTDSSVYVTIKKDNNGIKTDENTQKRMGTLTFNGSNGTYAGNYSTLKNNIKDGVSVSYTGKEDATLTRTQKLTLNADGTATLSSTDAVVSATIVYNTQDAQNQMQRAYVFTPENTTTTNTTLSWYWQDYKDTEKRQVLILNGESWNVTELTDNSLKLSIATTNSNNTATGSYVGVNRRTMSFTK